MANFIYKSHILHNKKNDERAFFIGIPVRKLKVLMTYQDKTELDYFEKGILQLLFTKKMLLDEIAETLCLNKDLTELVLNQLIDKELLTENYVVTDKANELLFDFEYKPITQFKILFYNELLKKVINVPLDEDDLISYSSDKDRLIIETETSTRKEKVLCYRNKERVDLKTLQESIKHDVLQRIGNFGDSTKVVSCDILNNHDNRQYYLITKVYVNLYSNSLSYFNVKSPLNKEDDIQLFNYFTGSLFRNDSSDSAVYFRDKFDKNVVKILESKEAHLFERNHELRDLMSKVKDKAFNKPIPQEWSNLTFKISEMFSIYCSKPRSYSDLYNKLYKIVYMYCDIFEITIKNLLSIVKYETTYELSNDSDSNLSLMKQLAKDLNFNEIEENGYQYTKDFMKKYKKGAGDTRLLTGICWLLLCKDQTIDGEDLFIKKIAFTYPNLLNELCHFYEIRKTIRHEVDPKIENYLKKYYEKTGDKTNHFIVNYINHLHDITLYLLSNCLGLTLNIQFMDEMKEQSNLHYKDTTKNKYKAAKLLNIDSSSSNALIAVGDKLISMLNDYDLEKPGYLSSLRSIMEDLLKKIVEKVVEESNINYDAFDVIDTLKSLGFNNTSNSKGDLSKAIHNRYNKGYSKTKNSNMGESLWFLVSALNQNKALVNKYFKNKEDFFILYTTLSGLDKGHNSADTFEKNFSQGLVEGCMDILKSFSKLYN